MSSEQPRQEAPRTGAVMRYIFLGVLLVTWVFWNVAVFHCTFFKVGPDSSNYSVDYKDRPAFGLFSAPAYEDNDPDSRIYTCVRYHPDTVDDFDAAHNSARFFGAFGYIVHSLAFFIAVATVMFVRAKKVPLIWLIVRILVIISLVCSLLIFTVYGSDGCDKDNGVFCVPGAGGIVAIFNIVFIIGAVVLSWLVTPPQNPLFFIRSWQEGDSTVAQPAPTAVAGQNVQKEDPKADPTQTINEEYYNEQATPVGPPTMSYIQNETAANARDLDDEAEA